MNVLQLKQYLTDNQIEVVRTEPDAIYCHVKTPTLALHHGVMLKQLGFVVHFRCTYTDNLAIMKPTGWRT